MAKDILLYGSISQYNALYFVDQINEATKDSPEAEMLLRINSDGGSPEYGWGLISKFQEMAAQFKVKVEAMAHSMALFILCYIDKDKIEAIDTARAVLHRAAYPKWFEENSDFAESIYKDVLTRTNKDLEKAFRARVDVEALEALPQMVEKNLKLKDIFSMDGRVEVLLSSADLKKIGLVGKIIKITPVKTAAMLTQAESFSKFTNLDEFKMAAKAIVEKPESQTEEPKNTNMTLDELKRNHPALYAQIIAEGHEQGVAAERDRVEAIMVFNDVDPKATAEAITNGKPLSAKQQAELMRKTMNAAGLESVKDSSAKEIETGTPKGEKEQTKKEQTVAAFEASLDSTLGLVKK